MCVKILWTLMEHFSITVALCTNNRTRTRLEWTFSQVSFNLVHPDLDSAPLFVGTAGERSINNRVIGERIAMGHFRVALDRKSVV